MHLSRYSATIVCLAVVGVLSGPATPVLYMLRLPGSEDGALISLQASATFDVVSQ